MGGFLCKTYVLVAKQSCKAGEHGFRFGSALGGFSFWDPLEFLETEWSQLEVGHPKEKLGKKGTPTPNKKNMGTQRTLSGSFSAHK
eukprot:2254787-Amphidinium_carterae.1